MIKVILPHNYNYIVLRLSKLNRFRLTFIVDQDFKTASIFHKNLVTKES